MPKINYKKLAIKETKPITKSVRVSQNQEKWFNSISKKYNTNPSTIIIHALEQTYPEFPKN